MPNQPHHTIGRPGDMDDNTRDPDIYGPNAGAVDEDPDEGDLDDAPTPRPRHFATGQPAPAELEEEGESDLDDIARELDEEGPPTTVLPIPGRPGWQATYSLDVSGRHIDSWRKRAKTGRTVDVGRFASLALAQLNVELVRRGRPITLEGEPQTFTSRPFMESLGVRRAADAVRKVYRLEGHMDAALRAVLREAGWGDELESLDED